MQNNTGQPIFTTATMTYTVIEYDNGMIIYKFE